MQFQKFATKYMWDNTKDMAGLVHVVILLCHHTKCNQSNSQLAACRGLEIIGSKPQKQVLNLGSLSSHC